METQSIFPAAVFCQQYEIEVSFIQALEQHGLLQTAMVENTLYLQIEELPELEKYTRLHYDLDINLEGIETIAHLLGQVQHLQNHVRQLQNRLEGYEVIR